eukprot:GHVS01095226.1.p1 GENE.GHVS01095226.1~~GHVS01095226.1.p1  ORF type:complete len:211 (-),score=36.56 GHVS01095226.1:19-651(-)
MQIAHTVHDKSECKTTDILGFHPVPLFPFMEVVSEKEMNFHKDNFHFCVASTTHKYEEALTTQTFALTTQNLKKRSTTLPLLVEALTTQTGTGALGGSLVGGGVGAMASGVRSASMGMSGGGKTDSLTNPEEYLYLDPKAAQLGGSGEIPRMRTPFKQAIVFVLGGGNYVEATALQELATKQQKQIVYGATDVCSPTEFMDQLTQLGSVR